MVFSATPLVYPLTWPPRLSRWGYCLVQVLVWGLYPNGCHLLMSQLQIISFHLLMLIVMYVCIFPFDWIYRLCMSHLVYCDFMIHVHSMVDSYCKRMRCWFQNKIISAYDVGMGLWYPFDTWFPLLYLRVLWHIIHPIHLLYSVFWGSWFPPQGGDSSVSFLKVCQQSY